MSSDESQRCRICGVLLTELARSRDKSSCRECRSEYIGDHRAGEFITDGSGCFYCACSYEAHSTCDRPGCENQTHGKGIDGKTVLSCCDGCRGVVG